MDIYCIIYCLDLDLDQTWRPRAFHRIASHHIEGDPDVRRAHRGGEAAVGLGGVLSHRETQETVAPVVSGWKRVFTNSVLASSFLLLVARHLLLEAMHLFLIASCC